MNTEKLKEYIKAKEIVPEELAQELDMNVSTWYRKIKRKGDSFTVKEMNEIIRISEMNLCDAAEIFFNEKLAYPQVEEETKEN